MSQPPTPHGFHFLPFNCRNSNSGNDVKTEKGSFPYRYNNSHDLNSKIMLFALVSLAFVLLLVILLHIYARYYLRRYAHRRRAILRSARLSTANDEHPKTGLDPSVIASLPTFIYKQSDHGNNEESSSIECAVCLSFLEEQEMARILPNCKHTFHVECIDKWLSSRSTCPICRTEAKPIILPVSREGPVMGSEALPILVNMEGTSNQDAKVNGGSSSRLSSFQRMLSREISSRRIQHAIHDQVDLQDLERQ